MRDEFGREIRYLRISITDLCNLRCRYCMPDGICKKSHREILTYEEITEIVTAAASLGVEKLRITGGEPLVRRDCTNLVRMLSGIPGIREITLTTNGILLSSMAEELRLAGVHRVNISLDSLVPEKYADITGGGKLSDVLAGVRAAKEAGLNPIKVNTVLIGGFNDDEIPGMVNFAAEEGIELRFIELMPMGGRFGENAYLPGAEVLRRCPELQPVSGGEHDGVARLYRIPGSEGKIGLISPLSHHFCSGCDRVRLTSEGMLKPCLHSSQEIPLRGKHGDALMDALRSGILAKPPRHGQLDAAHKSEAGRDMYTIGG